MENGRSRYISKPQAIILLNEVVSMFVTAVIADDVLSAFGGDSKCEKINDALLENVIETVVSVHKKG